jgi:hypothetical protein
MIIKSASRLGRPRLTSTSVCSNSRLLLVAFIELLNSDPVRNEVNAADEPRTA